MIYTRVADRSTTLFDQRTPLPHTPSPLPSPTLLSSIRTLSSAHTTGYPVSRVARNTMQRRRGRGAIRSGDFEPVCRERPLGPTPFLHATYRPCGIYPRLPPACVPPLLLLGPTNLPSRKGKRGGVTSFLGHICYSLSIPSILSLFFASRVNEIRKHWVNTLEISVRLINFVGIVRKGDEKREEKKGERKRDARFGGFFGVVGWPTEIRLGYL